MFRRICFTILILSLPVTPIVFGHDAWIEKRNGEWVVLYGHGDNHEGYDPAEVKECKGLDAKGEAVVVEIVRGADKASLVPKGDPAVLTMFYETGHKVRTTDGWKKGTKRSFAGKTEVLDSLKIERFCKSFFAPSDVWSKPVGHRLEIVPLKDPLTVRPGDTLPIKALIEGKPLEGAVVAASEKKADKKDPVKTDKEGVAKVSIERPGMQIIRIGHKIPFQNDPDADALYLSAVITFPASSN
jgi:nickel transport protein